MRKQTLLLTVMILILAVFCTGCSFLGAEAAPFAQDEFIAALEQAVNGQQTKLSFTYEASDTLETQLDAALTEAYDRYIIGENVENIYWATKPFIRSTAVNLDIEYKADYSDGRASAVPYSADVFAEEIQKAVIARGGALEMLFPNDGTITDKVLETEMDRILFGGEYAAMTYYLARAQYSVTTYDEYIVLRLTMEYQEDQTKDFSAIPQPETIDDAIREVLEQWTESNVATLYLPVSPEDPEAYCHTVVTTAIANDADFTYNCETYYWNAYGTRDCIVTLDRRYDYDQAELDRMGEEVTAAAQEIAAQITAEEPTEKVREIAEILCDRVAYDDPLANSILSEHELSHESNIRRTAYGALIDGISVCTGYAKAFQLICNQLGIECWTIDGTVEDVGHEWNAVYIDGEMYYVDVTFADTGKDKDFYLFGNDLYQREGYAADEDFYIPAA